LLEVVVTACQSRSHTRNSRNLGPWWLSGAASYCSSYYHPSITSRDRVKDEPASPVLL